MCGLTQSETISCDRLTKFVFTNLFMDKIFDLQIKQLKEELPKRVYVYVAGSTKFHNDKSEEICKYVISFLTESDFICLVLINRFNFE